MTTDQRSRRRVARVDALAVAAARAAGPAWQDLLSVLRTPRGYAEDYARALAALSAVRTDVQAALATGLRRMVTLSYRDEVAALSGRRVREAAFEDDLTDDERQALFRNLLLPAPDRGWVESVLRPLFEPQFWPAGVGDRTRVAAGQLAQAVALGLSQGRTQREIAQDVLPFVEGERSRARRAARTFGIHVAHSAQEHAWAQAGDLIIGFTLHSAKVRDSRPWHVARDGVTYWKNPGPGEKGLDQMPHPPLEPDDPRERPAGTPRIAWNCLCQLTAVLSR